MPSKKHSTSFYAAASVVREVFAGRALLLSEVDLVLSYASTHVARSQRPLLIRELQALPLTHDQLVRVGLLAFSLREYWLTASFLTSEDTPYDVAVQALERDPYVLPELHPFPPRRVVAALRATHTGMAQALTALRLGKSFSDPTWETFLRLLADDLPPLGDTRLVLEFPAHAARKAELALLATNL